MDDTSGLATLGYFSTLAESIVLFFKKKKKYIGVYYNVVVSFRGNHFL